MRTQEMGPSSRVYNTKFTWLGLKLRPKNALRKRITHHERIFTSWTRGRVHMDLFVFEKFVWTVIPFSIWLYFVWITLVSGENGRAFLFAHTTNIFSGPNENRHLLTGLHTVADVFCSDCREALGWKYQRAYEESQKYKEGKIVLEKYKIVKENW